MNQFYKRLVLFFAVLALFASIPLQSAIAVGRSVDDIVRVNNQWLIQPRNVTPAENE